ncbi:MAG: hypothetical protein AAF146_12405 [Bacteroidota bacterium]
MENNYLDSRVRQALENWDEPFQPEHWEQFERILNDPAQADLSEQALDHNIRHQLGAIQPAPEAGHWDQFEQQLDQVETEEQLEIEDVYLDGVTYELLNEMEVPYNPNHWPLMEQRLDEAFSLRRKLLRYKVAEVALLLLAIFTVLQFFPLEQLSTFRFPVAPTEHHNRATSPNDTPDDTQTAPTIAESTPLANGRSPLHSPLAAGSAVATTPLAYGSTTGDFRTNLRAEELDRDRSATAAAPPTSYRTSPLSLMKAIPAQMLPGGRSAERQLPQSDRPRESVGEHEHRDKEMNSALNTSVKRLLPKLEGQELGPLTTETPNLETPCLACEIWKGPSFLRVGMMGMGDLNYVMTPYNEEYGQRSYNRFVSGYGGGLTLGFRFGRWEIEGGALYASKRYRADTINFLVTQNDIGIGVANLGYEGKGWEETQLDVLRIPLRARYSFTHRGKWQFYGQGGAAVNVAMNVIHNNEIIRFEQRHRNPDNGLRSSPSNLPEEKRINYEDVTENYGILGSGNFIEQSFLTVDLGFGVERFLSPRFSVFTQPTFHYQLTDGSFGINQEKINNISVEVGVRVSLKKNTPEVR